jgi:hypothetical protein
VFVASGSQPPGSPLSETFFSHDGINWGTTTLSKRHTVEYIAFGNDIFLAIAYEIFDYPFTDAVLTHNSVFPPLSTVSFASDSYQVFENAGAVSITLTRSGDLSQPASVICSTQPAPSGSFASLSAAVDGVDYDGIYQTVVFNAGETTKTISIPIINNSSPNDGRRQMTVALTPQSDGTSVGTPTAIVSILDDDKSLQIAGVKNYQDTLNDDGTLNFSAYLLVENSAAAPTGPVQLILVAEPVYTFFTPSFDAPPSLPPSIVLGTFAVSDSLAGLSTAIQAVSGLVPTPVVNGNGYISWQVYANLEEQVAGNWTPRGTPWLFLDGAIIVLTNGHPAIGHVSGGTINPGPGGGSAFLTRVTVNGPDQISEQTSGSFTVTALMSDGTSSTQFTPVWSTSAFQISSGGELSAGAVDTNTNVTVTVNVTIGGITATGLQVVVVTPTPSHLGNISTRGLVQTGAANVMIGGFVISGTQPKKVIIHAGGPSLAPFGLAALSDPNLQLYDSSGAVIAKNDNWQTTEIFGIITSDQVSDIQNSGHTPSQAADSAIIATLAPGAYTAIVSGVNGATGIGIVEVFDLQ